MRRYLLASLLGHLGVTVVGSLISLMLVSPAPALKVMTLDLQSLPMPEIEEPLRSAPQESETLAPEIPSPPSETPLQRPAMAPELDSGLQENDRPPDLRAPEPLLPRKPRAVKPQEDPPSMEETPRPREEEVDFLEPEKVGVQAPEVTDAPPDSIPPVEAVAVELPSGGRVEATSEEGVSDAYLLRVKQKIGRRWRPTPGLAPGRDQVEVLVHFRIGPAGEVIAPAVARSSGLTVFDRQALRAVIDSGPLPRVPPRFSRTGLEIRFLFSYEPRVGAP